MITLRRAVPGDAATVRAVADAAFRHYVPRIGAPPLPMLADYPAAIRAHEVHLAEEAGQVIGFAELIPGPDHVLLETIAVLPTAQGRGVGSRLLALAEEAARQHGVAEVRLCTNEAMTENLAYYPRRGYVETHRGEQHGFRRVFFRKRLDA